MDSMLLQALATLCEKTEHDVRSCLNTLQFLSKRTKAIRTSHVSGLQCAQKDMVKSAFGVWQDLFTDKAGLLRSQTAVPPAAFCGYAILQLLPFHSEHIPAYAASLIDVFPLDWPRMQRTFHQRQQSMIACPQMRLCCSTHNSIDASA